MENDDGGHLIGSRFNGFGELDNLVPMNAQINSLAGNGIRWRKSGKLS